MTPLMHKVELTRLPRNMVALHRHRLRQRNLDAITTFRVVPLQRLCVLEITGRELVPPARHALLQRSKRNKGTKEITWRTVGKEKIRYIHFQHAHNSSFKIFVFRFSKFTAVIISNYTEKQHLLFCFSVKQREECVCGIV